MEIKNLSMSRKGTFSKDYAKVLASKIDMKNQSYQKDDPWIYDHNDTLTIQLQIRMEI